MAKKKIDADVLRALYGTEVEEDILKAKETDKQIRAFAGGSQGTVTVSVDEVKQLLKKANNATYYPGDEHRIHEYVVTDETVDRYGDIVRAKGVSFKNYVKNPVVQFAHDYEQPSIGIAVKTWFDKEGNNVRSWVLFHNKDVDPTGRSDLIFRLAKSNRMRACSIGFMPMEVHRPKTDEERAELGLGPLGVEFLKSDMMEFSPCPVPANPNALGQDFVRSYREEFTKILRSGLFTTEDVKTIRKYPLFGMDALDLLIHELDAKSQIQVPVELESSPAPIQQTININLDELKETLQTIQDEIVSLKTEVGSLPEKVAAAAAPKKNTLYEDILRG